MPIPSLQGGPPANIQFTVWHPDLPDGGGSGSSSGGGGGGGGSSGNSGSSSKDGGGGGSSGGGGGGGSSGSSGSSSKDGGGGAAPMGCVTGYEVTIRDPAAPGGAPLDTFAFPAPEPLAQRATGAYAGAAAARVGGGGALDYEVAALGGGGVRGAPRLLRRQRLAEVPGAGGARAACEDAAPGAPTGLMAGAGGALGAGGAGAGAGAGGAQAHRALLPPRPPAAAAVTARWAPPAGPECVTGYRVELLDASPDANPGRPLEGCRPLEVPAAAPPLLQARLPCAAAAAAAGRRAAARVTALNGAREGGAATSGPLRLLRVPGGGPGQFDLAACLEDTAPRAPRLQQLAVRTAAGGGGGGGNGGGGEVRGARTRLFPGTRLSLAGWLGGLPQLLAAWCAACLGRGERADCRAQPCHLPDPRQAVDVVVRWRRLPGEAACVGAYT
jgi:hypothetical protein